MEAIKPRKLVHCDLRHVALGGGMHLLQHLSRQRLSDLWQAGRWDAEVYCRVLRCRGVRGGQAGLWKEVHRAAG